MCSDKDKRGKRVESEQQRPTVGPGDSQLDPHTGPTSSETPQSQPDPAGTPSGTPAAGDDAAQPVASELSAQDGGQPADDGPSASPNDPVQKKAGRLPEKRKPARKRAADESSASVPADSPLDPAEAYGQAASQEHELLKMFGRKTAIHTRRMGQHLTNAKQLVDAGKWPFGKYWYEFLHRFGISIPTDNRARNLYERTESEEALGTMGIVEAYEEFGISIGRKKKAVKDDEAEVTKGEVSKMKDGQKSTDDLPSKEPTDSIPARLSQAHALLVFASDSASWEDIDVATRTHCLSQIQEIRDELKHLTRILKDTDAYGA